MPRKKMNGELSPRSACRTAKSRPILKPCPKFHRANIYQFAEHLNEEKCEQCMALSPPVGQGIGHDEISKRQQELNRTSISLRSSRFHVLTLLGRD